MSVIDPSLGRRIKDLRESLGEGQTAFGARFGVEQPTISRWEVGSVPKRTLWAKIAKVADVSQADFFFGISDPDEVNKPRGPNGKKPLVPSFDPDAVETPLDPDAAPDGANFPPDAIKELASKAGMGAGQTIATTYVRDGQEFEQRDAILDDYWRLPPDFVRGDLKTSIANLLVVNCRGDSMEPTLYAGDRLVVDTSDRKPSGDRIFAIRDPLGEIVVKRLRLIRGDPIRIQIVSDNPAVENTEEAFENVPIVGRVVAGLKLF